MRLHHVAKTCFDSGVRRQRVRHSGLQFCGRISIFQKHIKESETPLALRASLAFSPSALGAIEFTR